MVEQNMAVVRRWFEEVWNQKRSETIRELLSPDFVAHETSEAGGDLYGVEGFLGLNGLGMEATGAEIRITGMGIVRIVGGKVVETWDNWDKLTMFRQIEAAAKAKSAGA